MIGNNLGIASANVIANEIIRCNYNFAHYKLGNNNFGDVGVKMISDILCYTQHVVSLDLSMNRITSVGVSYIANALNHNQSLIELNLSSGKKAGNNRNRISEQGAGYLAEVLARNKFLQFLDLSGNCIGNEGAKKILTSVQKSNNLMVLNLDTNEIDHHLGPEL
jgi:NLR family CARD domain-containing protein 3